MKKQDIHNMDVSEHELTGYFKYCSDDPRVINGIFRNHKIRFTQPAALNDPLEFSPIIRFEDNGANYSWFSLNRIPLPSEESRLRHRLIDQQINAFGVLSLTKNPDSFGMWSRYANGHKGFLIEFKGDLNKYPCMLPPSNEVFYPIREVQYVDEYAINIDELTDDEGQIQLKMFNDLMFYRKLLRWKTEQEYRMVRPFSDLPDYTPLNNKAHRDTDRVHLFELSLDCIESVSFGACMLLENRESIKEACKNSKIDFLQAIIIRDEKDAFGKAPKISLQSVDSLPGSSRMRPFPFIVETEHFEDIQREKPISSLSELPYWEDNKQWVQQVYDIAKERRGVTS